MSSRHSVRQCWSPKPGKEKRSFQPETLGGARSKKKPSDLEKSSMAAALGLSSPERVAS